MTSSRKGAGTTLIEMIISIVLLGIVGSVFGVFILPAVRAYQAQTQRATLVDAGESALRRMVRDIRIGVPNSVRAVAIAGGYAIEVIPSADGGRHCVNGLADCAGASQLLDFTLSDTDFDVLGCFRNSTFTGAAFPSTLFRLVSGNTGNEIYAAAGSPAVMTPAGTSITLSTINPCGGASARQHIAIAGGHQFSSQSARQRMFVVVASAIPVSYICNASAGVQTLMRYSGYALQSGQPTDPSIGPLNAATSAARIADNVTACTFTSTTLGQDAGLLTLDLSLAASGETVRLVRQVQVDNSE